MDTQQSAEQQLTFKESIMLGILIILVLSKNFLIQTLIQAAIRLLGKIKYQYSVNSE